MFSTAAVVLAAQLLPLLLALPLRRHTLRSLNNISATMSALESYPMLYQLAELNASNRAVINNMGSILVVNLTFCVFVCMCVCVYVCMCVCVCIHASVCALLGC